MLIVRLWELLTEQPTVDLARMRPVVQPVRKLLCKSVCESIGGSVGKLIFSAQRDVGGRVRHSFSRAARASDAILEKPEGVGFGLVRSMSHACGSRPLSFAVWTNVETMAQCRPPRSEPADSAFLRPRATGRIARSTVLVSRAARPSSRNTVRPFQSVSAWRNACAMAERPGTRSSCSVIQMCIASTRGLSHEQWARIEPHLPTDVRGKERVDDRRVISGIVHVLKIGCRWSDVPPELWFADHHLQSVRTVGGARRVGGPLQRRRSARTFGPYADDQLHRVRIGIYDRRTQNPPKYVDAIHVDRCRPVLPRLRGDRRSKRFAKRR